MTDARNFIDRRLYRIRGFMHPVDAMVFANLLNFQERNGLAGGLAEIGVFFGRSFALMAQLAGGSKVIGLDLFDIPGQRDYVEQVLARLGLDERCLLVGGNSLEIEPAQLVERVGPIRFFSVDGGHERHHVLGDGELAIAALAEHGVIAFDDFMNSQYPDLSAAVIDLLRAHEDEIAPFCITRSKLYVTRTASRERYLQAMRDVPLWAKGEWEEFSFLDRPVVHVTQSVRNRAIYQALAAQGFGGIAGALTGRERRINTRQ